MFTVETVINIKLARTLWFNIYRGQVTDAAANYVASLRVIPAMPLERSEVPDEAPQVDPYIIVLVDDGAFGRDQFVHFETAVAKVLIDQMSRPDFAPAYCQFAYPNAAEIQ
jgi:hypothetical protein